MEFEDRNAQKKPVSVLQGDGFYFDRLLLRQSSVGHSSRVYYRGAEGVPFQWEKQPGTSKNPPENEVIPPPSPPPAVHSLGLPRPRVDQPKENSHRQRVWFWKRRKKSRSSQTDQTYGLVKINDISSNKSESLEFRNSNRGFNSSSSSSSSISSSNWPALQLPGFQKDSLEGPFRCSPWNITAILNEGNTNMDYGSTHKAVSATHGNGIFLSKSPSRNSSAGQSSRMYYRSAEGVPYEWEMQPGKSKDPLDDEVMIPPPSPPPAVQSQGLPRPCVDQAKDSTPSRVWSWKKRNKGQEIKRVQKSTSCKNQSFQSSKSGREFVDLHNSSSSTLSSSSSSKGSLLQLMSSWKDVQDRSFSCSPWSIRAILVAVGKRV